MKKIVTLLFVALLMFALVIPASAITTGKWDFSAIYKDIQRAVSEIAEPKTEEMVTVTYQANGGFFWNFHTTPRMQHSIKVEVEAGEEFEITGRPTRGGYQFKGWATNDGVVYGIGDKIVVEDDMTLIAVWSFNLK